MTEEERKERDKYFDKYCDCNHIRAHHCGVGKYAGNCIVVGCECKSFTKPENNEENKR